MDKTQDPEAAETARTMDSQEVDLPRLVRLFDVTDDILDAIENEVGMGWPLHARAATAQAANGRDGIANTVTGWEPMNFNWMNEKAHPRAQMKSNMAKTLCKHCKAINPSEAPTCHNCGERIASGPLDAATCCVSSWPECSGDPSCCPENSGYGCGKPNPENGDESHPPRKMGIWPLCDNCGDYAKWRGSHPDAGGSAVCESCVQGQGFKHLRLYSEILKRPMPDSPHNAEVRHGAKDADLD